MKKEKYIYGSRELEIANTKQIAIFIRELANRKNTLDKSSKGFIGILCFDKENNFLFLNVFSNCFFNAEKIQKEAAFYLSCYNYEKNTYSIIVSYNEDKKTEEKFLECVKIIYEIYIMFNVKITDYLQISENDFFSFYKSNKMSMLKNI